MMEPEFPSAGPTHLCPWGETKEPDIETPATLHPSDPAPLSRHPALTYLWPCSEVNSHHFLPCQSRGCLCGDQKRFFHHPKPVWQDINLHCPPQAGIFHCLGGSGLSGIVFILLTPSSKPFEESGSWVGLEPAPWSSSVRVCIDGRALSCQHHQSSKENSGWPVRGRTKAITGSQDGYCSEDAAFLLPLVPRKAHPALCPNPQARTQVTVMLPPHPVAAQGSKGTGARRQGELRPLPPTSGNRASRPPQSPIEWMPPCEMAPTHQGGESGAFTKQISAIAKEQSTWTQ